MEVPLFGWDRVVADAANAVGVAVIDDEVDGMGIECDCGIGDCCGACFVFMYLERSSLIFYIIHYNKNI